VKYDDRADRELSFYRGNLTAIEDAAFWRAKLSAERPGLDKWNEAAAILTSAGWHVSDEDL
jgi:hypothetical protein